MTINKMELRFNEFELNKNEQGQLKVSGYVNKTNQWSQTLGKQKKFVERILPGTFNKAIQNGNEIHFLAEHENAKILSSTRNGSLSLREDEQGLYMEATISDTSWGRDYHTLIKDGIIQNMSFGMQVLKDSWKKLSDGTYQRSISDILLAEVSAVRNPAYIQSKIQARSIEVVEDVDIPEENDTEEKQMTVQEKRELTIKEEIELKKSYIRRLEKINDDAETQKSIDGLKSELRNLQAQLPVKQNAETQTSVTNEKRIFTTETEPGTPLLQTDLIREKAKKMNGKHSLVARTNIIVQKGGQLDVLLEDAENCKKNLFVGDTESLELTDYKAQKVTIKTKRIGHAIEVSELLLEKSVLEDQEKSYENKLASNIDDSLNYCMLTGEGNMESLNADSSVSKVVSTVGTDKVSLIDVLTLVGNLNQEYRESAVFIMHTQLFSQILTNLEFKDHLEFTIDEFNGKKLYHLVGFPILVNDNTSTKRIIFGSLNDGYKTLISEGLKLISQDLEGNLINKEIRSFDLYKSSDSTRQIAGKPVYSMDAYVGGKVINKDCFARLDVQTVTDASVPEVVEDSIETAEVQSAEKVEEHQVEAQSLEVKVTPEPKQTKRKSTK
ncbi:HK97 family phage prohead protease [Bacillus wiedmannii]|uniref:HK97 family phage prohead protease n=1 Tax=Bacillus wiedmannii TaxID=1890302 RepID=UPI00094AC79B|nr:HK97 family phage prohead protease [Bacillus wiedmannii]